MAPQVEKVAESGALGEGPHWDVETQSLYYVDVSGRAIQKYTPATKTHTKATIGTGPVSLIIPVDGEKDKYLISIGRELAVVTWDGTSDQVSNIEKIVEVETDRPGNRFNDGKCDPSGRLWAGTLGKEEIVGHIERNTATLYSLQPDNRTMKPHYGPISESNGLAWNSDNTKLYYIDSPTRVVNQFDYDAISGAISDRKVVFSFDEHGLGGFPDGQTIDTDGNLWIAAFNCYKVIKIDPRRPETLLKSIPVPAKQVTSVTFGGPNLDELYVTSANLTIDGVALGLAEQGALFRITGLGVRGTPGVKVKL